jgi:bacteriocin biosynthesis cyclodehydratase domain-containing protein
LDELVELRLAELEPDDSARLDGEDIERYGRQLLYFGDYGPPEISAVTAQERLANATVAVIGCGGLGTWALWGLACAGVGHLICVDDDKVQLSNLNRQIMYAPSDVGRAKVAAIADALEDFNPRLDVEIRERRIGSVADAKALATTTDMIIATADTPPYEIGRWVDIGCREAGVPYISGGQFPPIVRIGPFVIPGETACMQCQELRARECFPLYDELTAFRAQRSAEAATLGPSSALIGSVLSMEAVHYLTRLHRPATAGSALIIDLRTMVVRREEISPHDQCDCDAAGR